MDAGVLIILGLIVALMFGALGSWIACQKHRDYGEGMLLGFLFGPLGCLIEALLPNGQPAPAASVAQKTPEQIAQEAADEAAWQRKLDAWRQQAQQQRAEDERRAAEMRRKLKSSLAASGRFLVDNLILMRWFGKLPGVLQPIILGIGIALPAVAVVAWIASR